MRPRVRRDIGALVRYVAERGGRCRREDLLDVVIDELGGRPEDLAPLLSEVVEAGFLVADLDFVRLPREQ